MESHAFNKRRNKSVFSWPPRAEIRMSDLYLNILKSVNGMPKNTNFFSEQAKVVLAKKITKEIEQNFIIERKKK